jgi:hypothetical protein
LHSAALFNNLNIAKFLIEECGADVHAMNLGQQTSLEFTYRADALVDYLRLYVEPKPKMFALCMGLHRRLGVDSPLKILNVDVLQEIAKQMID